MSVGLCFSSGTRFLPFLSSYVGLRSSPGPERTAGTALFAGSFVHAQGTLVQWRLASGGTPQVSLSTRVSTVASLDILVSRGPLVLQWYLLVTGAAFLFIFFCLSRWRREEGEELVRRIPFPYLRGGGEKGREVGEVLVSCKSLPCSVRAFPAWLRPGGERLGGDQSRWLFLFSFG